MLEVKYTDGRPAPQASPAARALVAAPTARSFEDWCHATGTPARHAVRLYRDDHLYGITGSEITLIDGPEWDESFLQLLGHRAAIAGLKVREATIVRG